MLYSGRGAHAEAPLQGSILLGFYAPERFLHSGTTKCALGLRSPAGPGQAGQVVPPVRMTALGGGEERFLPPSPRLRRAGAAVGMTHFGIRQRPSGRTRVSRVTGLGRVSNYLIFAGLIFFLGVFGARSLVAQAPVVATATTETSSSGGSSAEPQDQDSDDIKPIPVLQISAAFDGVFGGGQTQIHPLIAPVLLVPIGDRWLFEARGGFESDLTEQTEIPGFHAPFQKELDYAQLDFIANRYMTVTVGRFLTPFGIFNERLYPVWIRDLQSDPLILPIGVGPSNASTGAMVRGGFNATSQININYAVYYSTLSTVSPVDSSRFAGWRAGIYVPKARLELGGSFQHLLQDDHSNLFGFHAVWQPLALPLDIRAETARSSVGSGYYVESDYMLRQVPFAESVMRHTQIAARMQEFYTGAIVDNSILPANTKLFEFGVNYYFRDGLRAVSSYGRQFSPLGNANQWTIGLTYLVVVPLGHGGMGE